MRALTVLPRTARSLRLENVPEPTIDQGAVLVRGIALGVCGTDFEIIDGQHGEAAPGRERLILGHESLGRVEEAPADSGLARGDLVVGIVRRPDPVPCSSCAVGEWDMCRNGKYTEHGIKALDGFGAEWYRLEPDFAIRVDPALGVLGVLVEPASIVAKAWEHTERIGHRVHWEPRTLLVTGAGPIGLLAALLGAQHGLEVHVFDRNESGPKPELVRDLGGTYHTASLDSLGIVPDVVMECTGAPAVVFDVLDGTSRGGVVCLTGVSSSGQRMPVDVGLVNRTLVLQNDAVFGSVNANRRHYEAAVAALVAADRDWLARLITRRVPLERWEEAFADRPGDVKTVIELEPSGGR